MAVLCATAMQRMPDPALDIIVHCAPQSLMVLEDMLDAASTAQTASALALLLSATERVARAWPGSTIARCAALTLARTFILRGPSLVPTQAATCLHAMMLNGALIDSDDDVRAILAAGTPGTMPRLAAPLASLTRNPRQPCDPSCAPHRRPPRRCRPTMRRP